MECYCYLRVVQDLLADVKTPYERRSGESFKGPIIPFGALVEYLPTSERDKARIHQFGKKVLPRIFPGYALIAVRIWKGDILIADIEELEKLDGSEIYPRRLNAKGSPDNVLQRWRILYFLSQMVQQNYQQETTNSKNPL